MQIIPNITLRLGEPGSYEHAKPGQPVDVPKGTALNLIKCKKAVAVSSSSNLIEGEAVDVTHMEEKDDEINQDLLNELVDAIDGLGEDAFGKDGKPGVKALEEFTGYTITADTRDQAWAEYKKQTEE